MFHFSKHHHGMAAPLEVFLSWMVGVDIRNSVTNWYTGITYRGRFHEWFTWQLYNSGSARKNKLVHDTRLRELRALLAECLERKLINQTTGNYIELSSIGLEQYSISYILGKKILGNAWIKAIGVSVITVFTGYLITTYVLKEIKTTVIELRYVPQEISKPAQ